jgi:hypothetical protein
MEGISIGRGERLVLIGPPRHGKSNIEAWLLDDARSAIVWDSKHHPDEWVKWGPAHGYVVTRDPADISRHPKVVFQVDHRSLVDRAGWTRPGTAGWLWTDALTRAIARGNTVNVFDEAVQVLPAGASHPQAQRIYTQGAGFGSAAWAGSQIGNRIDTLIPRLAEHAVVFRVLTGQDLDLIAKARGLDCAPLKTLDRFHWAYHRMGDSEWRLCGPVDRVM